MSITIRQFEIHEVEPDFVTWRDYAVKAGYNPLIVAYLSANQTALYTFKPEETADIVFATPRSWAAVGDLLDSGLKGQILKIKTEANIGAAESIGFFKYIKNTKLLPNIEAVLNGTYLDGNAESSYSAPIDAYWLLIQNFIHAIGGELRKDSGEWRHYADNSVDFICDISKFPLELKKSYVDQLCDIDKRVKEYMYNVSQSRAMSRLLQELDYIK